MKELERILKIRECALPEEVSTVDDSLKTVSEMFKAMIRNGANRLKETEEEKLPYEAVREALKNLHAIATRSGIEFPTVETEEQINVYVMKYGMEVVKG